MNFLNNPEYSSLKIIAVLVVVAGLGFFVFGKENSGNLARIFNDNSRIETAKNTNPTQGEGDPQFFSSPTIVSIIPNVGPTTGGALVTITGTSFSPDITATLDSLPCTDLSYVSDTEIKCKTPPHSIDLVDVTITEATGTATLTDGYQYIDAPVTAGSGGIFNNQGGVLSTGGTTSTSSKKPKVSFESDKGIHEEAGTFTVTATLSFTSNDPVTVPFTIASTSTALNPADYSLISANPLIIPANELSGSISFKVLNDSSYENDESVMLTMGTPVNATSGDTTHTTMIDDNDVPPTVSWVLASQTGNENVGTMKVEAKLSFQVGVPVTVPFTYIGTGGTASTPADYTMSASPIIIPANTPSYFTTINVVSDPYPEGNETVVVKMGTPTNATPGNITTHTATITDAQPPCKITSFNANPTSIGSGASSILFWTTGYCTSTSIDQGINIVTPVSGGSVNTPPLVETTTFILTASSAINTVTAQVTVEVVGCGWQFVLDTHPSEIDWYRVAMSADGSRIAAVAYDTPFGPSNPAYIYTSSDSGVTWVQQTNSGTGYWQSIAMSADGMKIVAIKNSNYVFTSINGGVTWAYTQNPLWNSLQSITSSADGTKLAVADFGGYIYTSTNGGSSWVQRINSGIGSWYSIASSADGTKLAAVRENGYIYTSSDSGFTWTQQTNSGTGLWRSIASSADGTKLAAVMEGGYIYTSTNSGATWTKQLGAGHHDWLSIASSADGIKLVAADRWLSPIAGGDVHTSTDGGVTWKTHECISGHHWEAVASSADGSKLVGVCNVGHVHTTY